MFPGDFAKRVLLAAVACFIISYLLCPNAVAEPTDDPIANSRDPRLDRTVDFSSDGSRVTEVLANLSKSTGVALVAGIDDNDWMVYDRKVVIYAKGMSLRDLMKEISTVLRFKWKQIGEENQWTYQLVQGEDQRAEEESLRSAAEDTEKKRYREKRENVISDLLNLISLPVNETAGLKTSNPWRYVLATEPLGRELAAFINGSPEVRNAIVQGLEITFPVSSLPTNLQDTVRRLATSYDSLLHSIGATEDHADLISRFDKLQITINPKNTGQQVSFLAQSILGQITIGTITDHLDIPILDPSSKVAQALGAAIVALKSGVSKDEVAKQLQSDLVAAAKSSENKNQSDRDITSDLALRRNIQLFAEQTVVTYPMVLKKLAETTGFNVVSDYFPGRPVSMEGGEKTLGEYLELVRNLFGANWEKVGNTIRFRDREWFKKRTWEVPQVWIDYWIARGDVNDGLQLEDLVQIASLRDEQIDNTIMLHPKLVNLGAGDAARNRHILRFYALLNDTQRTTLTTTQLEASALTDQQWAALQKALASAGAAYAASVKGSQTIKLEQSGSDIIEHKFSYYPTPNEQPITFTVRTGLVYRTDKEVVIPPKRVVVPAPSER